MIVPISEWLAILTISYANDYIVKAQPEGLVLQDLLTSILRSQLRVLRAVRTSAASEGLTTQQFGVLRLLALNGEVQMNVMGDELAVSPPVITGMVDRLEAKGLVKRKESEIDRRRTEVFLTESGNKLYQRVREHYRNSLGAALRKTLTLPEQDTLAVLLERFSREIRF